MKSLKVTIVIAGMLAACSCQSNPAGTPEENAPQVEQQPIQEPTKEVNRVSPATSALHMTFSRTCAENDAAIGRFIVSTTGRPLSEDAAEPVRLDTRDDVMDKIGTIDLMAGRSAEMGAFYKDRYVVLERAVLEVTERRPKEDATGLTEVRGRLEFELPDGKVVSGPFETSFRDEPDECG